MRPHDRSGYGQREEGEAVEGDAMLERAWQRLGQRPHERQAEVGQEGEQRDDGRLV